ncbi:hypothetical protein [Aquipuribacter sp. SD81]|uniref:hypothetical protein n=1 Tax=Aquipuribacter sp. SD81 TaxID=3127703 RepID=UPI0030191A40
MSPSDHRTAGRHEADVVRETVLSVPGVVDLHGGSLGEVGTYLPGRRVVGVRLRPERTEVHVVVTHGSPVRATADLVRGAVARVRPGAVDVTVEDVAPAPAPGPT